MSLFRVESLILLVDSLYAEAIEARGRRVGQACSSPSHSVLSGNEDTGNFILAQNLHSLLYPPKATFIDVFF
jgi:hypothetical protein